MNNILTASGKIPEKEIKKENAATIFAAAEGKVNAVEMRRLKKALESGNIYVATTVLKRANLVEVEVDEFEARQVEFRHHAMRVWSIHRIIADLYSEGGLGRDFFAEFATAPYSADDSSIAAYVAELRAEEEEHLKWLAHHTDHIVEVEHLLRRYGCPSVGQFAPQVRHCIEASLKILLTEHWQK